MRSASQPSIPLFSIVTVVRNEAAGLPKLLASIAKFRARGGEVVVLDTGSEDDTIRIAKEAECRVLSEPGTFEGALTRTQVERIHAEFARNDEGPFLQAGDRVFDFAAARNRVAARARHPFQLAVDGRDVLDSFDIEALDTLVREGGADVVTFETRRLHHGTWVLEARDYCHDRRRAVWRGRAHNHIAPRTGKPLRTISLPREQLRVTHHSDDKKTRGHQLAGVALDVLEAPQSLHRRLILGHELSQRGHFHSALAIYRDLDRPGVLPSVGSAALSSAAACLSHLDPAGSAEQVLNLLFKASRVDPTRRQPLLQLARHFLAAGQFQSAASFAFAALAVPARVGPTEREEDLRAGVHAILYWSLLWLGRKDEAREHHRACLRFDPLNAQYREHARFFAKTPRGRLED